MDIQAIPKVKCIIGMIYSSGSDLNLCLKHLEKVFGPIDELSDEYLFDVTQYYENEMGKDLKRKFISFMKLIEPQQISEIKRLSNIIEIEYSTKDNRSINLDPGYLDMDKFVLGV